MASKYNESSVINPFDLPTLVDVLNHRALRDSSKTAYIFLTDGESAEERITYAQLDARAHSIAAMLKASGANGEPVLLLYPSGIDYIAAFFGCLYAGAIAVPAYPPHGARLAKTLPRLQAICADSQARVALTTATVRTTVTSLQEQARDLVKLDWLITDGLPLPRRTEPWKLPSRDDIAFLQYTSGSTAAPKGVMVSHGNLMHNEQMLVSAFSTDPNSVCVGWLPLYHDMGLIGNVLHPLYVGFPSVLMSPMQFLQAPMRWLRAISRYRGTVSGGPNFAYELCHLKGQRYDRSSLDLSTWKRAFNGAEPVRFETLDRFATTFEASGFRRASFFPCYGLAEATLIASGSVHTEVSLSISTKDLLLDKTSTVVSSGTAVPGQRIAIVDVAHFIRCPDGHIGEIWLGGPNVTKGYWRRTEETQNTFGAHLSDTDEGPFLRTGDLGFLKNGQLCVTGRLKDLIIIRGRNHYPQDIEQTVQQCHRLIRPNCVAAFSIATHGEEQLVVVQEVRSCTEPEKKEIFEAIRQAIARQHDISVYALVLISAGTISKTSSGKIQRHASKQAYLEGKLATLAQWRAERVNPTDHASKTTTDASVPDRAAIRAWLLQTLSEHLGVPPTSLETTRAFAHYGIDSKTAVSISGELEEWLKRRVSPTVIYQYPTIEKLSGHLAGVSIDPEITGITQTPRDDNHSQAIAIIGLSCRFPASPGPEQFWKLLCNGVDAVRELPENRWNVHAFYAPTPTPGKMYTKHAALLDNVDQFDPQFFGISPREARAIDPQQRILLEVAWDALENAGRAPDTLMGSPTGVFVGISGSDYAKLYIRSGDWSRINAYAGTGTTASAAAGRLSYILGLQGPSMVVDTACSSSLVAVHLACQSLRNGECTLALAGGVSLILSPESSIFLSATGALSPDGRCRTFDANANGYGRGEGCAVVVLKRLSDAQTDGDSILAVIRGSAVNQDGRTNGLTAPNGQAQKAVIRTALARANVRPCDVSYVEAHGTGTPLGDPIEVSALGEVFAQDSTVESPLLVGSVKTNIGHLETAAGIAGLIKVVLSLQYEQIPANLHLSEPSPRIPWEKLSLKVPTQSVAWKRAPTLRRIAGVSAFGMTGTNAHVIVEEAPPHKHLNQIDFSRAYSLPPLCLLRLSGRSQHELQELAHRFEVYLATHEHLPLFDICAAANRGQAQFEYRAVFLATSRTEMKTELNRFVAGQRSPYVSFGQVVEHSETESVLSLTDFVTEHGNDYEQMLRTLAKLHVQGTKVNWTDLYRAPTHGHVFLPTYPRQSRRLWIDSPKDERRVVQAKKNHDLLVASSTSRSEA